MNHLVLRLATMYHEGKTGFHRPLHLLLESLQLFVLKLTAPVIVKPHLAYSNEVGNCCVDLHAVLIEDLTQLGMFFPVGLHLLRMESYHGIGVTWILITEAEHSLRSLHVYSWQEHLAHSCFAGTGKSLSSVFVELLGIEMRMCVDNLYHFLFAVFSLFDYFFSLLAVRLIFALHHALGIFLQFFLTLCRNLDCI